MRRCALLVVLVFAGCGFLSSRSKSNFYSLETIGGAVHAAGGAPLAIDAIELPPGFDRRDIVVRKAGHQMEVRGTEQWSASLEPLVLHTLSADLANRLPPGAVILPGQLKAAVSRSISVVFEELAAGPEPRVVLNARWTLGSAAHHEEIAVDIASLGSADVADGLSRALATLADRIAASQ